MSYTTAQFEQAAKIVQELPKDGPVKPTQTQQLNVILVTSILLDRLECSISRGKQNGTHHSSSHQLGLTYDRDAWNALKGTSKEDAQTQYVKALLELLESADDEDSKNSVAKIKAA
ncbi:12974_t:CDS:2 [Acaulospora colombiana]|uniref:12974_t:CDS:1 n=1 Tax=Acaulospora colombiana TaxID=27376 RepID=A0ACA9PB53_9GLOM|nr:12974_t:CDS:2 [Acaulospora colombiana]